MKITLRNGDEIELDWNPIVLEYLEEYEGGIKQLKMDIEDENSRFRAFNYIIYCMISAIYPKTMSYREILALVCINDYDKIIEFIATNFNNIEISDEKEKIKASKRRAHRM